MEITITKVLTKYQLQEVQAFATTVTDIVNNPITGDEMFIIAKPITADNKNALKIMQFVQDHDLRLSTDLNGMFKIS